MNNINVVVNGLYTLYKLLFSKAGSDYSLLPNERGIKCLFNVCYKEHTMVIATDQI